MKKTWKIIYVVLTVCVMAVPFAGMAFFRTDTTTENKRMAEMPKVSENGSSLPFLSGGLLRLERMFFLDKHDCKDQTQRDAGQQQRFFANSRGRQCANRTAEDKKQIGRASCRERV